MGYFRPMLHHFLEQFLFRKFDRDGHWTYLDFFVGVTPLLLYVALPLLCKNDLRYFSFDLLVVHQLKMGFVFLAVCDDLPQLLPYRFHWIINRTPLCSAMILFSSSNATWRSVVVGVIITVSVEPSA